MARPNHSPTFPAAAARPPRTLLVGTAAEVHELRRTLERVSPPPAVVGCLLDGAGGNEEATILGRLSDLGTVLHQHRVAQVLISLPLTRTTELRRVSQVCEARGVAWRYVPLLSDILAGRLNAAASGGTVALPVAGSANLDLAQLIDRQPRPLDDSAITACLAGKRVLITGAGGSIGSELARLVAGYGPEQLILVERSENALFDIDREIARRFPTLRRTADLHDVTQQAATLRLIERRRPDVIFHAAAHKHVPMMEDHPSAAVENNFLGTRWVADAASVCGAERFVMISSDKAVNPSSVMGATKRLAELYIQHLGASSRTIYSMVRFGNVLGSACSVLPIWTEQLSRGGPITVTHPDMSRYFMTIPEAAGLVLQAGALSEGGEVFLLDMGSPVRIVDLAERFLRMQGYAPGVDVEIAFTGIRPGEKLFEELAYGSEDMRPTPHASIRIWRTAPPDAAHLRQIVATFDRLRDKPDADGRRHAWAGVTRDAIVTALRSAIPEMVAAAAG